MTLPQGPADPTRLSFCTAAVGMSGEQAAAHFRSCGVEPEYADGASVVLIPTPWNTEQDLRRCTRCDANHAQTIAAGIAGNGFAAVAAHGCSLREAVFALQEEVPCGKRWERVRLLRPARVRLACRWSSWGKNYPGSRRVFLQKYGFFEQKC